MIKEFVDYAFPFRLHLGILQLEEYKIDRYLKWNFKNFFKRKIESKKELIYTNKIRNIIFIFLLICLISLLINPIIFVILILEPFIGLSLSVTIMKPYEIYKRKQTIQKTKEKILDLKKQNLKVIGITGSFGKTSTKEILYQILKTKYKVLKTPESFNTIFGVAKVVDLELDNYFDFFICEMAAYKMGEIKELCEMVPLDFGILTGITTQHFERFGSLENTIKAKFELVDAIKNKDNIAFNLEDKNITNELQKRSINIKNDNIKIEDIKFTQKGSSFNLVINNKKYKIENSLFGFANIKNTLLAIKMANKLGMKNEEIVFAIKNLKPADNRMVLSQNGKATVINNTYSSNIQSFKEIIETAKVISGKKALITPGIVELGNLESKVHEELGILAQNVFDIVILVGKNNRTKFLAQGLQKNYEFIDDKRENYFKKIEELKNKYDWIFLENDITQNY